MKEIDLLVGDNITHAYEKLATQAMYYNKPTYGIFNDKVINSTMTLDECYESITGYTKDKFDKMYKQKIKDCEKKKEEFDQTIPDLVAEYTEKGKKYLEGDQLDLWIRMLPSRFGDLYQGMEIGCTIEILEAIKDFEEPSSKCIRLVNDMLEKQGHSGMSYKLMKFMLENFSKFGPNLSSRLY